MESSGSQERGEDELEAAASEEWQRKVAASLPMRLAAHQVRMLATLEAPQVLRPGEHLFVAGISGFGDPSSMERLCFVSPNESIVIDSAEALKGHVSISSRTAAVDYVRLFTSPATVKCLTAPWWVEVISEEDVDSRFWFLRGDAPTAVGGPSWPSGHFGLLTQSHWARSGLSLMTVRRSGVSFVVARPLIKVTPRRNKTNLVYEVEEMVSPDGGLERRTVRRTRLSWAKFVVPVQLM